MTRDPSGSTLICAAWDPVNRAPPWPPMPARSARRSTSLERAPWSLDRAPAPGCGLSTTAVFTRGLSRLMAARGTTSAHTFDMDDAVLQVAVHRGSACLRTWVFPASRVITIGSAPESLLRLEHGSVSARHAVLYREGGQLMVAEPDGGPGIQVNGVNVRSASLGPTDDLRVGVYRLRMEIIAPAQSFTEREPTPDDPFAAHDPQDEVGEDQSVTPAFAVLEELRREAFEDAFSEEASTSGLRA